jgi:hypothetical protein
MPFLVRAGAKSQEEQKCLMYATVFNLQLNERFAARIMPIYRTNAWRKINQVANKMIIARNTR